MTEYSGTIPPMRLQGPSGHLGAVADLSSCQSIDSAGRLLMPEKPAPYKSLPPQLIHNANPTDKKKQRLARNRATAALSRERKKAHADVLTHKVALLEKSNLSLTQQLAAKTAEVTFLKSQLKGQVSEAGSQEPSSDSAPEVREATQTHIVMPAASALPRIFCSVANPPSSTYPHQANTKTSSHATRPAPSIGPAAKHPIQPNPMQTQCKLEQSMSNDMSYQPITIKPELSDNNRSQRIHAVITSGNAPALGGQYPDQCQQQLPSTDYMEMLQSQPMRSAFTEQDWRMQPCVGPYQHFAWGGSMPYMQPQKQTAEEAGNWQQHTAADGMDNYVYQNACSQTYEDASGTSPSYDQLGAMSSGIFSEQELMAWKLLPQQLPQLEELPEMDYNSTMHASTCKPEPDCLPFAEDLDQKSMQDNAGSSSGSPEGGQGFAPHLQSVTAKA